MEQTQQVLPIQCVKCGVSFDLWHDLLAKGITADDEVHEALDADHEHLCWDCRRVVAGELEEEETQEEVLDVWEFNFILE
jgi:DNA-directed RNA polymerase subunit N (RpoN/RPB10)